MGMIEMFATFKNRDEERKKAFYKTLFLYSVETHG